MTELSFNYPLHFDHYDQKKNRYTSIYDMNAEWSFVCLQSHNGSSVIPEILKIRRKSTSKEILISGTLKLKRFGECVLQRTYKQLLEVKSSTTIIDLEFSDSNHYKPHNPGLLIQPINCEFSICGTLIIPDVAHEEYAKGDEIRSLKELSNDLKLLLDAKNAYFFDVNLKCGNDLFSAHKNILCVRSPVFAAMLTTEMRETIRNEVDITDISPPVLKTMLTHIYTGKTGELSVQTAGELLFAADKYQLQDLKRVCCDYLKSCISAENVVRTLVLGYLHDNDLKVFAMDFICNSIEEFEVLEKTEEWTNMREQNQFLAMDVLTALVKSKWKKKTLLSPLPPLPATRLKYP